MQNTDHFGAVTISAMLALQPVLDSASTADYFQLTGFSQQVLSQVYGRSTASGDDQMATLLAEQSSQIQAQQVSLM